MELWENYLVIFSQTTDYFDYHLSALLKSQVLRNNLKAIEP